jgi:hypothetical protein
LLRRRLVEQRVRLTNRLTAALKEYFPQVLQWFDDKGTLKRVISRRSVGAVRRCCWRQKIYKSGLTERLRA